MEAKLYRVTITTPVGIFHSKAIGVKDMEIVNDFYTKLVADENRGFLQIPFFAGNNNASSLWLPGTLLRNSVFQITEI